MLLALYGRLSNAKNSIRCLNWLILTLPSLYFYIMQLELEASFRNGLNIVQLYIMQLG